MKKKMLVILGPTSTGKTDLAILLAKRFNGELISADSRQVYKFLDIGTGKLPGVFKNLKKNNGYWEIDGVKVWMYDVLNPGLKFNLYEYILRSEKIVKKIFSDEKLPILVGGTGLYIRSLLNGVSDFGHEGNEKLREKLENFEIVKIREKIEKKNPAILKILNNSDINNKRRLIRIYEKLLSKKSGNKFTGLDEQLDILKIGLKAKKEILDMRIKERVVKRIDQGMIDESIELLRKKILTYSRMEELGLEYRYIAGFLKGGIRTLEELVDILSLRIRQYAKRQMTWFKKEESVEWFDAAQADIFKKVEYRVSNWYNKDHEQKD